ncbi:hypothetical protein FACS1894184_09030 [Clostridia bacterium]|nr:hypothetical protein FACS1894184_09030 [Clostridia bacterium]
MKAITINDQLDEDSQRIILAHEIGHAVGHSPLAKIVAFHDFAMLVDTSIMEYEANEFAAELLLDDEEVLDELNENDFFNAASSLNVPPELLIFKLRLLKR